MCGALHRVSAACLDKAQHDRLQVDFQHMLQSPVSDSYLSAGLGWEKPTRPAMQFGRIAPIGQWLGTSSWSPNLKYLGTYQYLSTISVESGLMIEPMLFISFRAAYCYHLTGYTGSVTDSDRREVSDGPCFGGEIQW